MIDPGEAISAISRRAASISARTSDRAPRFASATARRRRATTVASARINSSSPASLSTSPASATGTWRGARCSNRQVPPSAEHPTGYAPVCVGTTTSDRMERFTRPLMERFRANYLPREADYADWRASPALAKAAC